MAERTIRRGFIVFTDVDGRPVTGYEHEVVDVHEDDLERFDRLNGDEPVTGSDEESADAEDAGESTEDEPYKGVTVPELKTEIETRNADREDDAKITVPEPGNRPELVAALVADDAKQS
ncbi:hypothetical protein [Microbacterium sp. NPDC080220]|uniref:hypothetical protein n=1 Tax=Microbacterium sp. NPDC080220 TaxID=3161017 RepID=UPI00341B29BE